MALLRVNNGKIVGPDNESVFLRGVCLGGWLNFENFILGFSGVESVFRKTFLDMQGADKYIAFINAFYDNFICETDIKFLSELGVNAFRLPVNFRMIEEFEEWKICGKEGFFYVDKAITWAKKHGMYIILDLHAAPGCQNSRWHSDNISSAALLWDSRHYQESVCKIWQRISERYRNEDTIAGYDLLNEPEAEDSEKLRLMYEEIIRCIRSNRDNHIIFIEGNKRGEDFDALDNLPFENIAFSTHNYMAATLEASCYPGKFKNTYIDKSCIEKAFLKRNEWILKRELPSYVGEFGVLLDGDATNPQEGDLARINALSDFIKILNDYDQHWTLWSYKDLIHQGLLVSSGSSEYRKRVDTFLRVKKSLSLDPFVARKSGCLFDHATNIVERISAAVHKEFAGYDLNYNSLLVALSEQNIATSAGNFLVPLFVDGLGDLNSKEMRRVVKEAFAFEFCERRDELIEVLKNSLNTT